MTDTQRLEFLIDQRCVVTWSKDHEVCGIAKLEDVDGQFAFRMLTRRHVDPRAAIDAAMAAQEPK